MAQTQAVTAAVIGAGQRGRFAYGGQALAFPERLRIVAVAEPDAGRRAAMAREHGLPADRCFDDWRALLARPQLAAVAVIATADTLHVAPTLEALARGYHVLLEKPIAPEPADCARVVGAAERAGRIFQIGHVLRYAPFYERVHEIVAGGRLGRVWHIELKEHVGAWHMAHSFVRGRFRNRTLAAPILLAKSCHDLDLLIWLAGALPARVASFGRLSGYSAARAPAGAPERCTQGCPVQAACAHDAERFYLGPDDETARVWPWSDVSADPSRAARRRGLETGPYGRCVYRCDNDVLDHQLVAVEFEDGLTAAFSLHGHAAHESRVLRITGEEGELRGVLERGELELLRPGRLAAEHERIPGSPLGHFGGDHGLVAHFVDVVRRDAPREVRASGREALEGHLLGFAAERARERACVIDCAAYRREIAAAAAA
jgi:predicted dehydrogenase